MSHASKKWRPALAVGQVDSRNRPIPPYKRPHTATQADLNHRGPPPCPLRHVAGVPGRLNGRAAHLWAGWWRGLQKAAGRDIFMATADETQLGWCWYEGAGSISIHQPHVCRLFLDLNSNQFPAVGLFESHVTFGQWASRPGPLPRLENVRKTWWAWTEITSATFRGVAGHGVCPGLATNSYRQG